MELEKFQNKNKKDKFYPYLFNSLMGLQRSIDSQAGNFNLDIFLSSAGEELEKNGVSLLVTIFSDTKNSISIRFLNDANGEKLLRKSFDYFFLDSVIEVNQKNHFSKAYLNKEVQFIDDRQKDIYGMYPGTKKNFSKYSFNSIVCPILIKNEVIGFFEFISPDLKEKYLDIFEFFSRGLVKSISSSMLFKELKESEQKFKDIFENADEGFYILNGRKKKFVEVNKALSRITDYTKEELLQMNYLKIFSPDETEMIDSYVKERLKRGRNSSCPRTYETKIKTKGGREKIIKLNICRYISNDEWFVIISDIDEAKIAEQKLYDTKKHYLAVVDTIRDGIFVVDKSLKILSYNKFFSEKVGLEIDKIKREKCYDILPKYENCLFFGEHKKVDNMSSLIKEVFKSGVYKTLERRTVVSGKDFYYKIDISPTKNREKEIYQAVVTISNITKNREAEEEIRKLDEFKKRVLNNVPLSIVMLDKKGKIISLNNYAQKLMGENSLNKRLVSTKEIKNNKKLVILYNRLIKQGKSFRFENLSYRSIGNNNIEYLNIIAAPLFDAKGGVDGAISMAVDNTEATAYREKIESLNQDLEKKVKGRTEELALANKKLNEALELKLKFISDASHELRTPLTIMKGNLDLLLMNQNNIANNLLDVYRDVEDEITRMSNIISDLTMLTNADSQIEKLCYEKVDITKLLQSAVKSLSIIAKEKNISLKFPYFPRAIFVMGDELKLDKVLINLIRNAIKYTDKNGTVKISINKNNEGVFIKIKDNGIGIPEKDLANIFERFYRVDKARSRMEGGTGLGLSICKWIVDAHDGTILVESREGVGSEFKVKLPVNKKKS